MSFRFKPLLMVCVAASTAVAQTPAASSTTAPDSTLQDRRLFVRSDFKILGFFAAGTVLMFPLDRHLASVIRDEDLLANKTLLNLSKDFRFFGGPGPYIIGSSLFVAGRLSRVHRAAELGLHGTEAVVVGQAVSGVLKVLLGRARPYISEDTNPSNFAIMRGTKSGDFQSFPSGHSTSAFAAAAAVSMETSQWWPQTKWILGPILYGGAALVGVSRIYDDKHWASDVIMGAAVGTFAGLKTVRFNHTHTGNRLDRWLLGTQHEPPKLRLLPAREGGVQIGASLVW